MFCILLANLRKWVKIPYNLLCVNEHFEGEYNAEITLLDNFLFTLPHLCEVFLCVEVLYQHSQQPF